MKATTQKKEREFQINKVEITHAQSIAPAHRDGLHTLKVKFSLDGILPRRLNAKEKDQLLAIAYRMSQFQPVTTHCQPGGYFYNMPRIAMRKDGFTVTQTSGYDI